MRHDLDDQGFIRSLYYRILIEKRDWSLILREAMQDGDRQLGWAYARLAACFMLTGKGSLHQAAAMFWEAYSLFFFPPLPFSPANDNVKYNFAHFDSSKQGNYIPTLR